MSQAKEFLYLVVGAGDVAVEKVRALADPKARKRYIDDVVERGRAISSRIENSAPSKQAVAQTKAARSQVKAAVTSVNKAVRANARATRNRASRVVKAS
jgi:hypothetical protein